MAQRLRRIVRHVTGAGAAAPSVEQPGAEPETAPPLRLLSDAEMEQFVAMGYISLPVAEFGPEFHRAIHERAEELFATQLNYGNTRNIYPVLPELEDIMHGPTVAGALTSVLGPDYVMDRRKHMHNSSSQGEQRFHKDCQRGKSLTGHMPRCCMIFYAPAGCTEAMGPTEILPGSHCLRTLLPAELDTDAEVQVWDPEQMAAPHLAPHKTVAPLRQGTITMVHYDLVHRGTARFEDEHTEEAPFRPLFKFLYNRTVAPTSPSWDHGGCATPSFAGQLPPTMRPVAQSMWEWLSGSLAPPEPEGEDCTALLEQSAQALYSTGESAEDERVGCAYALGRRAWHGDTQALDCLLTALATGQDPNARRAAVSGLGASGDAAVPGLLRALAAADRPQAAAQAAEALGEACRTPTLGAAAGLADAMEQLRSMFLEVPDEQLRDRAVLAPGHGSSGTSAVATQAVAFCTDALKYMAQRLHAQLLAEETSAEGARALAAALLAALSAHPSDGEVVRECRGKALLTLAVLPRGVWADGGAALASALTDCSHDPSQYTTAMGSTGLARMARAEGGSVGRAREAVLARQSELRYIALDNTSLH